MARSFSGTGEWLLNTASAPVAGNVTPFTMACWLRTSLTANNQAAMSCGLTAGAYFRLGTGNAQNIAIEDFDGAANPTIVASGTYTASTWTHAAGVWTSSTSRTVYRDGANATSDTTALSYAGDINRFSIGSIPRTTPVYVLNGQVAEAAIWTAALTAAELAQLAAGVSPRRVRPLSLIRYWPIGGYASPEIDLMTAHQDLTVTGATAFAHPRIYLPGQPTMTVKGTRANTGAMFQVF